MTCRLTAGPERVSVAQAGPGPRRRASSRPCGFVINGRFLTQPVTGVQRYAREIVGALDAILAERRRSAVLLAPASLAQAPAFAAVDVVRRGALSGQAWEQTVLPFIGGAPSLNLCNTAPLLSRDHVVCMHDANVFEQPDSYGRSFRTLYKALQPIAARRALRVTTVSHSSAALLARHLGLVARDIRVLPNGHEHALRWDPARAGVFVTRRPRRTYILLLASRARHKNVGRIVGLAEAVDALGLDILVAGGQASIFAEVETRSAPNLVWLGKVSDDDLALLFSNALCLAFPSLTEGFGLPVIEAMAWGCPVVASDRASLPEICGPAALMADPEDDDQWIRHFAALARSRDLGGEMSGRGRERIAAFSWSASAHGYLQLLEPGSLAGDGDVS